MSSRRVSLPVSFGTHLAPSPTFSPQLQPPIASPTSSGRRSLPTTPQSLRRLPIVPRSPASPRPFSPRLPDLDERFPTCSSSSSSDTSPRHLRRKRITCPRYQYSLRDSGYMEHKEEDDELSNIDQEGTLRSFAYKNGAVIDHGYQVKSSNKNTYKRKDTRRSTCPEIWLMPEAEETKPSKRIVVRIYGSKSTGKKTLAHNIYHHATTTTQEQIVILSSENTKEVGCSRYISFLLNGEEVQLEILQESALECSPFGAHLTMYLVVYNIDSRESFLNAAQLLNRIHQTNTSKVARVLLVANKVDLKRNQVVSSIEGKSLAKIYKCSFVEVSALLIVNIDGLWSDIIKQLEHPGETTWMERIVNRGKTFAKSCEEIVQKLIVT
ncbi:unnamed protein product [Auanema sp. JU1783]|nr:unnamed protein product [Auanema sp. JU1783]